MSTSKSLHEFICETERILKDRMLDSVLLPESVPYTEEV